LKLEAFELIVKFKISLRICIYYLTMNKNEFTNLFVWQKAHKLLLDIYLASKYFPVSEKFGLSSQMKRAAVSITSNISEGYGRRYLKEKIQFYYIASGSISELKNQLIILKDLNIIELRMFNQFYSELTQVHQLLFALIRKTKSFKTSTF
jgi:four helix bundle protein